MKHPLWLGNNLIHQNDGIEIKLFTAKNNYPEILTFCSKSKNKK